MAVGVELTSNRYLHLRVQGANVEKKRVAIGLRTPFVLEPGQQALRRVGDRELSVGIGVASEHLAVTLTLDQESSLLRDGRPMPLKSTLLQNLKRDDRKIEVRFRDGTEIRLRPVAEELAIAFLSPDDEGVKSIGICTEGTSLSGWRIIREKDQIKLRSGDHLRVRTKEPKASLDVFIEPQGKRSTLFWIEDSREENIPRRRYKIEGNCFREFPEGELRDTLRFPGLCLMNAAFETGNI